MTDIITTVLTIFFIIVIYNIICNRNNFESFNGALQSLYSNDGIQDAHLTVHNHECQYDPYVYWRGIPWNLPTRNLNRMVFYPYLYEYHIDRYARMYPYW